MELLIAFVANLFTQFLKGYVAEKWGVAGVYFTVFMVAFIGTVIYRFVFPVPEWQAIIMQSLETLAYAIAMYEMILKRVGFSDTRTAIDRLYE